jgi:hypothetical protein
LQHESGCYEVYRRKKCTVFGREVTPDCCLKEADITTGTGEKADITTGIIK